MKIFRHEKAFLQKVGESISLSRKNQGLTQERLSELSGLDRSYIGRIERGEVNYSLVVLYKIARALGISVADILEVEDNEQKKQRQWKGI